MLLSILIPTLENRREQFARIYGKLSDQIRRNGLEEEVEILFDRDGGSLPTGQKRNRLMGLARGRFIVFVDDDDDVHDRYAHLIVDALKANPETDVVGIWAEVRFRGRHPRRINFSVRHASYEARNQQYTRPPHHLNPMRAEIARRYPFEPEWRNEDADWALRISRDGPLRREHMIDEVLYYWASRRFWFYQMLLDRTEWLRHPLGLVFTNRLRARRWLRDLVSS